MGANKPWEASAEERGCEAEADGTVATMHTPSTAVQIRQHHCGQKMCPCVVNKDDSTVSTALRQRTVSRSLQQKQKKRRLIDGLVGVVNNPPEQNEYATSGVAPGASLSSISVGLVALV